MLTVEIDPYLMGEPVKRHRFYILLVRTDVAVARGQQLDEHVQALLQVGLREDRATPAQRMLPNDSPHVREYLHDDTSKRAASQQGGVAGRAASDLATSQGCVSVKGKISARARAVMHAKLSARGLRGLSNDTNIDVAQSMKFARVTSYVPTITPGSVIVVGQLRRVLIPIEKILLNAVPVHEAVWPGEYTHRDFADFGGNTMHLMAVGKAMLMALALVDWRSARLLHRVPQGVVPEGRVAKPRVIRLRGM